MRTSLLTLATTLPLLACGGDPPAPRAARAESVPSSASASGTSSAAPATAAPADPEGEGRMTGALGVPFGATREAVLSKLGTPEFEQAGFEGIQQIGYPVTVMGQASHVVFAVDRRHGMMRALIMAPVEDAGRCTLVLALWQHGLEEKYGPGRSNGDNAQAGCEAFAARNRPWGALWKEESSGRRILLALMPGNAAVTLTYDTPQADAWERRKNASQL